MFIQHYLLHSCCFRRTPSLLSLYYLTLPLIDYYYLTANLIWKSEHWNYN